MIMVLSHTTDSYKQVKAIKNDITYLRIRNYLLSLFVTLHFLFLMILAFRHAFFYHTLDLHIFHTLLIVSLFNEKLNFFLLMGNINKIVSNIQANYLLNGNSDGSYIFIFYLISNKQLKDHKVMFSMNVLVPVHRDYTRKLIYFVLFVWSYSYS